MPGGVCKVKLVRSFIQLARPVFILIACLLYFLGAGISRYLSGQVERMELFLGFGWIVLILIGFQYLNEYFYILDTKGDYKWWMTPFSGSTGILGPEKLPRPVALWAGLTCLIVATYLTILLNQNHWLNIQSGIILGVIFVGEMVFAIPPLRLVLSGYGELIMALLMAGFIPAQAFLLQGQEIHRLMVMVSLPLVFLFLGMLLAFEFPAYASDNKYERRSLLIRIGWQKGMLLHNILVVSGFLIFGLAFIFGFPLSLGWPALLVLPVGFMQVWMMNRIAAGGKPNWNVFILIALSTFCLTAYLLTFSFWTH
jgi:1,4-dihydroxy-2-naphthoate octaprenyltransferase